RCVLTRRAGIALRSLRTGRTLRSRVALCALRPLNSLLSLYSLRALNPLGPLDSLRPLFTDLGEHVPVPVHVRRVAQVVVDERDVAGPVEADRVIQRVGRRRRPRALPRQARRSPSTLVPAIALIALVAFVALRPLVALGTGLANRSRIAFAALQ